MMGGSLQKLQILRETYSPNTFPNWNKITVLFNPNTLRFNHAADWNVTNISGQLAHHERRVFDFKTTRPVELSFELFFDISKEIELSANLLALELPGIWGERARLKKFSARLEKIVQLAQVDQELHRPPVCKLIWGTRILLHGVLTSLDQKLIAFTEDGTPTRAELSCTFTSVESEAEKRSGENHSADVAKRRVIRQGDTLQSIAREEYGDASLWRPIARQNRIAHPLQLVPGTQLLIPPLE
jgi:hypothetical protein